MARTKRTRDEVDDEVDTGNYQEDDFVENDDNEAPKSKKSKKSQASTNKSKSASSSKGGEETFELSTGRNPKRIGVSDFKGQKLINIREYYEKDGDFLPGKKGISLTPDQYKALLKAIPRVNAQLAADGIRVDGSTAREDESEEETKPQRLIKAKKTRKANIEATSDEDEDENEDDDWDVYD